MKIYPYFQIAMGYLMLAFGGYIMIHESDKIAQSPSAELVWIWVFNILLGFFLIANGILLRFHQRLKAIESSLQKIAESGN